MTIPLMHPGAAAYAADVEQRAVAACDRYATELDVPYGSDARQRIDVFGPAAHTGRPLPLVAFIHGGGWVNGDRKWMAFMAESVTALPAVFVSIGYRLAPAHRWPLPAHDCQAALAFIVRNATRWHIDPERVCLGGHSAGAHLAAWVATHLPAGVHLRVCAPVSGSFDLRFRDVQPGTMEERVQKHLFARPADEIEASPMLAANAATPPFIVAWGDDDFPRIREQGPVFGSHLRSLGVTCTTLEFPDADHFAANLRCADSGGAWLREVRKALSIPGAGA